MSGSRILPTVRRDPRLPPTVARPSEGGSMSKPITPRLHGLIDYGFAAANLALPSLLHMTKGPKLVFGAFGLVQGTLNALTAQPVGLKKAVPFRMHGTIEKTSIPLY